MTAFRRRGERTWTDPVTLGESSNGSVYGPVALSGDGDATAVFMDYPPDYVKGAPPSVRVVSSHNGKWDATVTMATCPGLTYPGVVVNDAGDAVVYWADFGNNLRPGRWDVAYRSGPFGAWEPSDVVANGSVEAKVGIDKAGNVLVLFAPTTRDEVGLVRLETRSSASNTWSSPTTIADTRADTFPGRLQLAVNARGDAAALWVTGDYHGLLVQSVSLTAGGRWTRPEALSRLNEDILYTSLVIDRAGNALAAWTEEAVQFTRSTWTSYRRASTGRWEPEVVLDPSGQLPHLAVDASGNAVALWQSFSAGNPRAALWPSVLGAWTSTQRLTDVADAFDLGLDSQGHALAAWSVRSQAGLESLETSDLVPSGPLLATLHLPKKGTRGVPVTFRVTPAPWGSALEGVPIWRFGDGTGARGTSVSHVFRRLGNFEVSVTQVDRAGRRSMTSGRIVVDRGRTAAG